jgi:hypothetical protein
MKRNMRISIHTRFSSILLIIAIAPLSTLWGCRFSKTPEAAPLPLSQRVTWSGVIASRYSDSLIRNDDTLSIGAPLHIHRFLFAGPDSFELRLSEYREIYWAYAAFQRTAGSEGIVKGVFEEGKTLRFTHGTFLGAMTSSSGEAIEATALREKLDFQGEDFVLLPKEFAAFPLLGRVPHSERVISSDFLGRSWRGPVFTVGYKCHGDTGTAFRAFPQDLKAAKIWIRDWTGKADTLDWGREIHFQGWDEFRRPLIFWIFSDGVIGFTGCYDTLLAQEYAEKMEKIGILWPKP